MFLSSFLQAAKNVVRSSTESEERERLGEDYASDSSKLVDWLYICGDYNTQATLVELLLR